MDLDLDLDTSWIEKEEKRFSLDLNYKKSPMDSISCVFIYIDRNHSIQKIIKKNECLTPENRILNSRFLQLIEENRHLNNGMKYKIFSILKYIVDLEPEVIQEFTFGKDIVLDNCLKEISMFNNILIDPSIFIFHPLNSLYFFLKEDIMVIQPIKSILKTGSSRSTKKVRIMDDSSNKPIESVVSISKKRGTRKNIK